MDCFDEASPQNDVNLIKGPMILNIFIALHSGFILYIVVLAYYDVIYNVCCFQMLCENVWQWQ